MDTVSKYSDLDSGWCLIGARIYESALLIFSLLPLLPDMNQREVLSKPDKDEAE